MGQQVVNAFNLKGGAVGGEILELVGMHGEGGTREVWKVVGMYDLKLSPITTGMQAKNFLQVLREVHAQWMMEWDG